MSEKVRIAIVGGGFTGAVLAVHLTRAAAEPLAIDIFEPRETVGAGLAYGACGPEHRINVPCDRMTVFAEDPLHFSRWLRQTGIRAADPQGLTPEGAHYPKRHAFAAYMAGLVRETAAGNPSASVLRHRRAAVLDIKERQRALEVSFDGGTRTYDHAVLCASHGEPAFHWSISADAEDLPLLLRNPWRQDRLAAIPRQAAVFILGTGLTMADVVVTLRGQGHGGPILAVSRHGLTPMPHAAFDDGFDLFGTEDLPKTALALLRFMRRRAREAEDRGLTWHAAIDALRRQLATYWPTLPIAERAGIVRRLRAHWDVHRFRMAPQVAQLLAQGRNDGWLRLAAGRIDGIGRHGNRFAVRWSRRGGAPRTDIADAVVNCTGPNSDIARSELAILRNLADRGSIRADPLRIGIDVDRDGRLFDQSGRLHARLWAAGPLARAVVGEATGVPEASQQARVVAGALASAIAKRTGRHAFRGDAA